MRQTGPPDFLHLVIFENKKGLWNNLEAFRCTVQQEYFEHLERFLLLIEPIIEDLERKKFI